jgi:sirohydrochlorin cobaltochelatase
MPNRSNAYKVFEARLKILLPEEYRDHYEDVQPVSMGSAGLKFASDGRVAWDQMWRSFCDLAMAGGPPHRGKLLEPGSNAEIETEPGRYEQVVAEICRGIELVTELVAEPSATPGWIDVNCPGKTMVGWLVRAITMENVSAHSDGMVLHLPAGPHFRLEKEIKNVITSIAKTSHYWLGHTSIEQHRDISGLFEVMDSESPLIQIPFGSQADESETLRANVANEIHAATGLHADGSEYHGWLGVNCHSVPSAIQMMRAMVVSNVLCRREDDSIYVPINPSAAALGSRTVDLIQRAYNVFMAETP